jgi:HK97 family phage portal protein
MIFLSNKKMDAMLDKLKALQFNNVNRFANFSAQIYPVWKEFEDAYQTMDMIHACIKKLATNAALVPLYGYNKKTDADLPDSDKLVTFLDTLDFEQKELMYTFLWDFGEVFAYKVVVDEGVNKGLLRLVFLHPLKVNLRISNDFPQEITGYVYKDLHSNVELEIPVEDMIFIKLPNPSTDPVKRLRGLAPSDVLAPTLNRISSADAATVAQLQNGGTPGIVYDKVPGLDPAATGNRKNDFAKFLRNSANKGAPYFAGNELGYLSIGTPLADLAVTELASVDLARVCNVFGISTILFNDHSASTESNVEGMKKEMFENVIIPNVTRITDALNKSAVPDIQTTGYIKADTSEIKALQEDQSKLVAALSSAWWITGNEKRTAQMYDQVTDEPLMDKIIIPSGMMVIEDLNMVPPIDNAAGDYVAPADANKTPKVVPLKSGTNG